jgi:hypothetical protein
LRPLTVCCWLVAWGGTLAEHPARAQSAPLYEAPAGASTGAHASITGDQYMAQVLATLQIRPSVAARLRHKSRLHETAQAGSGRYWQRGTKKQRVTRWEMQTQVAGKTASYLQVFDRDDLWTDRTLPSGRRVYRLDTTRLQSRRLAARTATRSSNTEAEWEPMIAAAEGQGGLAEMLADALRRFTFAPPRPSQLDGMAVHVLVGQWRRTELEKLWPELASGADSPTWPKQLPHHVLLLVGQNNLFPYVVEHRRVEGAHLVASAVGDRPVPDPLLRYELYEVQFTLAMEDSLFQFKPGDVQWTDETSLVLERSIEVAQRAVSSPTTAGTGLGDEPAR